MVTLKKYGIEPKVIKFIHPRPGEEASLILLEGIKGGKGELKIQNPLFLKTNEEKGDKKIR